MAEIKYYLLDDDLYYRASVQALWLHTGIGMKCIGDTADANELFVMLKRELPDVVLVDLVMAVSGRDVFDRIRYEYPGMKVLIFSVHSNHMVVRQFIEDGAAGYISKSDILHGKRLIEAFGKIMKGDVYLSPAVDYVNGPATPMIEYTGSQIELIKYICQGWMNKEIADVRGTSERAVELMRERLARKMGVRSSEIRYHALKNGLCYLRSDKTGYKMRFKRFEPLLSKPMG